MRLTDHVTLNFNNKMSTAAVFLDIEKAFDTTWHPGLLYKLSKLGFSTNIIKLLGFPLTKKIQGFGRRRDVYAKGNASRGGTRFGPVPGACLICILMMPPKRVVYTEPCIGRYEKHYRYHRI
jgi:hypothetical protein